MANPNLQFRIVSWLIAAIALISGDVGDCLC